MPETANGHGLFEVLVVDDDPGDVDLIREVFEEVQATLNLHVVQDGVEAMAYIKHHGPYSQAVCPDLILLDLNMPKKDGREVLYELKTSMILKVIPVVVLTTSDSERDIERAYQLGANCFVTKPVGLEQFVGAVRCIADFWVTAAQRPPRRIL
jgi:CheY-like chemotaxis protein